MISILFIYFNHYHDSKTLSFIYFVSLKVHRKPLVYAAQCRVPGLTLQNKSRPSKVTPPTKDTWLHVKNRPRHSPNPTNSLYIFILSVNFENQISCSYYIFHACKISRRSKIKDQLLCYQINVKISSFCNLKLCMKK